MQSNTSHPHTHSSASSTSSSAARRSDANASGTMSALIIVIFVAFLSWQACGVRKPRMGAVRTPRMAEGKRDARDPARDACAAAAHLVDRELLELVDFQLSVRFTNGVVNNGTKVCFGDSIVVHRCNICK